MGNILRRSRAKAEMEALVVVIPIALCCGLPIIVIGAASLFKRMRGQMSGASASGDNPIAPAQDLANLAYERGPRDDSRVGPQS